MTSDELQREIAAVSGAGRTPGDLGRLRAVVVGFRDEGGSQEAARSAIEASRSGLTGADDDTLLELLDAVVGWCAPEKRIWPETGGGH